MPSFKPVVALTRGLEILRVVNEEGRSTIRSLHKATRLDKATIVRMLETLEHEGYIMRDASQAIYAPTGRTLALSQGYDRHLWMGAVAEPVINAFRARIGWPSDVAICDHDAMVLVRTTRGNPGPITFDRPQGWRAPMLATAVGRAYLAFCGEAERGRIVGLLARSQAPWTELAREPRKLHALLEDVRERGYAVMDEEYSARELGGLLWAFAVPIGRAPEVFGAINLMMLRSAVTLAEAERSFLAPLQETAAELAEALVRKGAGA